MAGKNAEMSHPGRVIIVQALLGIACTVAFYAVDGASARSAALALLCSLVPSAYYAWVQGRTFNATRLLMHGVLRSLFTVSLITVCIVLLSIEPFGFFVTLAIVQLSYFTGLRAHER